MSGRDVRFLEIKAGDYYVRIPLAKEYIPLAERFIKTVFKLMEENKLRQKCRQLRGSS